MAASWEPVERAAGRAAERARTHVPSGAWTTQPLDLVADAARQWPGRLAIADRGTALTYAQLDHEVGAAATTLRSLGAGPSVPVLVVVQNDVPSTTAIHAALRVGAVALVVPISAGRAQLSDIVDQVRPTVALAPRDAVGTDALPEDVAWRTHDDLAAGRPAAAFDPRDPTEPSIVIFTSGTTSRPKGVIHSLDTMLAASRNYIDAAELHADDRLFVVSPLASITGMLQCVTVPAMLGAQVVLETKWEPAATCELLLERGGTFFGGPDLLLDRLLDEVEARGATATSIGAVYLGGAMLDPRILDRVEHRFGIVVLRAYGSSEAPISTAGRRGESREARLADDGSALGGVTVRRGSRNDPAECCIAGPHLFLGYIDADDDLHAFETDEHGTDWFCTGDVADLTGGRVKIVGRIRDIVIRKGLKVPISEVEGFLNELPGIARSAGYATADPETGERLAVAIIPADGAAVGFDEVVAELQAAGLATWKLPEELVLWDEPFPENATGKVVRNRLEEASAGRPRLYAPRLREERA